MNMRHCEESFDDIMADAVAYTRAALRHRWDDMHALLANTPCQVCLVWFIARCLYVNAEIGNQRGQGHEEPQTGRMPDGTTEPNPLAWMGFAEWWDKYMKGEVPRFELVGWDLAVDDILAAKLAEVAGRRDDGS